MIETPPGMFRVYGSGLGDAFDRDGYPVAWQQIKHIVRSAAGDRCERCHHPYKVGNHPLERVERAGGIQMISWSDCDAECRHPGPYRVWGVILDDVDAEPHVLTHEGWMEHPAEHWPVPGFHQRVQAAWRVLTVHHLTGDKADCRWWNLAALCQRCHLTIQGKVVMEREFIREHTTWMQPHAAGFYAAKYLGEDLTRDETMERLTELLALEFREKPLF